MRITLVEDNEALARGIAYRLHDAGHAVNHIMDGAEADAFLSRDGGDLIILDISLPSIDGLTLLRNLRARGFETPVICLTARADTPDLVEGLDAGADDYLPKPFEMAELEARIRALSRRRPTLRSRREEIGGLEFDISARRLLHNGASLDVPRRELAVFECLFFNQGRIVSKGAILDSVYGVGSEAAEAAVEVYVSRLRKRLAPFGLEIRSARGLGYMLEKASGT